MEIAVNLIILVGTNAKKRQNHWTLASGIRSPAKLFIDLDNVKKDQKEPMTKDGQLGDSEISKPSFP